MTKQKIHPAPVKNSPSKDWEHYQLYKDVREAIASLPIYFRTDRIPASLILGYLAEGCNSEQIVAEFPDLDKEQIAACLDYARELAEFEVAV